jgi:hypothetical protein
VNGHQRQFKDALLRAGAPKDAVPYSFRHTFISRRLEQGMPTSMAVLSADITFDSNDELNETRPVVRKMSRCTLCRLFSGVPLRAGQLYVCRGVGHLRRVRFNVRPKVTLFDLSA